MEKLFAIINLDNADDPRPVITQEYGFASTDRELVREVAASYNMSVKAEYQTYVVISIELDSGI